MPRKKTIQPEPSETFTMEDGTVVEIRNHETRGPLYRFAIERQQQAYIRRYEADFPYWLKMETWRWDEGAALIHGLEPRTIKLPYPDSTKEFYPIIKSWVECREHAVCALRAGQLKEFSKPVEFLRWAESIGYPIPEGLQGFYKACENGVHKKPTEQTSKVLTGVMEAQDEYVPLFPLLGNYWDKPLSELPEELQARLIAEGFEIGTGGFSWDESTPNYRRVRLTKMDKDNALAYAKAALAYAMESFVGWHDATMDARTWWSMPNVKPEHAAMVLSRLNPNIPADCEDPASIYVDGDESSPHRYRSLLLVFESEASTSPKPRTLMEWRTIAQQYNLRYHSWIDDYADAMGAPAGKVGGVPSTNPSSDDDKQIDTTNLVYWRAIVYSNIKKIDEHKKASARGIIKYLRGLKDKRIPNKGGHDELFWIDDNNNEQCLAKKTINNAASLARKLP